MKICEFHEDSLSDEETCSDLVGAVRSSQLTQVLVISQTSFSLAHVSPMGRCFPPFAWTDYFEASGKHLPSLLTAAPRLSPGQTLLPNPG